MDYFYPFHCCNFALLVTYAWRPSLDDLPNNLWITLSVIISAGTLGAALIPEFTKYLQVPNQPMLTKWLKHPEKVVLRLNILSGLVAGNFSAFWKGMVFLPIDVYCLLCQYFWLGSDDYDLSHPFLLLDWLHLVCWEWDLLPLLLIAMDLLLIMHNRFMSFFD
jgi:hypothetical protein